MRASGENGGSMDSIVTEQQPNCPSPPPSTSQSSDPSRHHNTRVVPHPKLAQPVSMSSMVATTTSIDAEMARIETSRSNRALQARAPSSTGCSPLLASERPPPLISSSGHPPPPQAELGIAQQELARAKAELVDTKLKLQIRGEELQLARMQLAERDLEVLHMQGQVDEVKALLAEKEKASRLWLEQELQRDLAPLTVNTVLSVCLFLDRSNWQMLTRSSWRARRRGHLSVRSCRTSRRRWPRSR